MMNKKQYSQFGSDYRQAVLLKLASEHVGIHISLNNVGDDGTEIALNTSISDKEIMLEVLSEVLRNEGFIVALGEN